jgi:hypothetical protein
MVVVPETTSSAEPLIAVPAHATKLVLAGLFALLVFVLGDLLFAGGSEMLGGRGSDLDQQFVAWREFGFGELAKGNLALWNPHIFGGAPYFGGVQSALLYPPNWLFLVLPVAVAMNWSAAINIWLLGAFMALWALRRGLHPLAAFVAGALLMFSGPYFTHAQAGHVTNLATMTWVPLLFLAFDGFLATRRLSYCLLGMLALSMQWLAGHPQYVFYSGVALALYGAARVWKGTGPGAREASARGEAQGAALGLLAIYVGGSLLSAVQLFSAIEAASEAVRSGALPYDFASMFAFPLENLATLLAPGVFGDGLSFPYWGRGYLWEHSLFIGVCGLALASYGAVRGETPHKRALAILALAAFVLALGDGTPLFALLYHYAPGFDRFRAIAKFCFFSALVLCLFAGVGLDSVLKRAEVEPQVARFSSAALGVTVSLALIARVVNFGAILQAVLATNQVYLPARAYADPQFIARAQTTAADALLIAAITLGIFTFLLHALRRDAVKPLLSKRQAALSLAALAVLEIAGFARLGRATMDQASMLNPQLEKFVAEQAQGVRIHNPLEPNNAMSLGAFDVWGADPGVTRRYAELVSFTQRIPPDKATQYVQIQEPHRAFAMLRLRYMAASVRGQLTVGDVPTPPLGRFVLVGSHRVLPSRDARLYALTASDFDPRKLVLLEEEPNPRPRPAERPGTVKLLRGDSDHFDLEVFLHTPSLLLITDAWSAAWRAEPLAPGPQQNYRVLPANHALRAIPLAAGKHQIRVAYAPFSFSLGIWTSLAAWLAFVGLWLWHKRLAVKPLGAR